MSPRPTHAVVLGSSITGLLAAAALAKHFAKVTVIERDEVTNAGLIRKGVPQSKVVHVLLARGAEIAEKLLPGLRQSLLSGGAVEFNIGQEFRVFQLGGYKRHFDTDLKVIGLTRLFLESHIRKLVLKIPNVELKEGYDVNGLVAASARTRIRQVKVTPRSGDRAEQLIDAELVVDATGRGSKSSRWLEELGYPPPPETVIKIRVGYASRMYAAPQDTGRWKAIFSYPASSLDKRCGGMLNVEPEPGRASNRWQVALYGWCDEYPRQESDFVDFARSLPTQDVYNFIQQAEPLGPVEFMKVPVSARRHYERVKSFPDGFIVMGDALCAFNPIYGQGMSMSAIGADILDRCLADALASPNGLNGLWREFFQRIARPIEDAWMLSAMTDLRFPEIEGPRGLSSKFAVGVHDAVGRATLNDPHVSRLFFEVVQMISRPQAFFTPGMLWRLWRAQSPLAPSTHLNV